VQTILKMALANGVARAYVGLDGVIATPAASCLIREKEGGAPIGGILLTASHNPGGPDNDFGIKFNTANGGPAPESFTDQVYAHTKDMREYRIARGVPDVDLAHAGEHELVCGDAKLHVSVVDTTDDYAALVAKCFDMDALRELVARPDFELVVDAMHGAAGPYVKKVLGEILGCPTGSLRNCKPSPDFGGGHPDPNLTYAPDLVSALGLTKDGAPDAASEGKRVPDFGAACDGDGDRNMILGSRFFVTPSDSLAIVAAHAHLLPQFRDGGGLQAVARSMPTGGAVDRVAEALGIPCFETPSGWKYFGNLMDSRELGGETYDPLICGEESFGLGSSHVREKDGVWAILCWLSILAHHNQGKADGELVSVRDVVTRHWARYGRNYYTRHDYEECDGAQCKAMMKRLAAMAAGDEALPDTVADGQVKLEAVDEFSYTDPVDGSVATKQGVRCLFEGGARAVFRLSGTGSVGATVRLYVEKYVAPPEGGEAEEASPQLLVATQEALAPVVKAALEIADLESFTGRDAPTVIT